MVAARGKSHHRTLGRNLQILREKLRRLALPRTDLLTGDTVDYDLVGHLEGCMHLLQENYADLTYVEFIK